MKKRRWVKAATWGGLFVVAAGVILTATTAVADWYGSGGDKAGQKYEVMIKDDGFMPAALTVPAGTTVTWKNDGTIPHTVTSGAPGKADGGFASGDVAPGKTFKYKFDKVGTYSYFCEHAPTMVGTVTVTAK